MRKLEIGPSPAQNTPDGAPVNTWDTVDSTYAATYKHTWGDKPLPIEDNKYDWVHASHVLEHIPWWKVQQALRDVYRIIDVNGRVTIWVPDALKIIHKATTAPDGYLEKEKDWACAGLNPQKDLWVYMNARVFWGARPKELGQEQHWHRSLFGEDSLKDQMKKAGFRGVAKIMRDTAVDRGHGWMEIGMEGFK